MGAVVIGVFIAVLAIIFGAYWLVILRPEQQQSGAVRRRLKGTRLRVAKADIGKSDEPLSTVRLPKLLLTGPVGVKATLSVKFPEAPS